MSVSMLNSNTFKKCLLLALVYVAHLCELAVTIETWDLNYTWHYSGLI